MAEAEGAAPPGAGAAPRPRSNIGQFAREAGTRAAAVGREIVGSWVEGGREAARMVREELVPTLIVMRNRLATPFRRAAEGLGVREPVERNYQRYYGRLELLQEIEATNEQMNSEETERQAREFIDRIRNEYDLRDPSQILYFIQRTNSGLEDSAKGLLQGSASPDRDAFDRLRKESAMMDRAFQIVQDDEITHQEGGRAEAGPTSYAREVYSAYADVNLQTRTISREIERLPAVNEEVRNRRADFLQRRLGELDRDRDWITKKIALINVPPARRAGGTASRPAPAPEPSPTPPARPEPGPSVPPSSEVETSVPTEAASVEPEENKSASREAGFRREIAYRKDGQEKRIKVWLGEDGVVSYQTVDPKTGEGVGEVQSYKRTFSNAQEAKDFVNEDVRNIEASGWKAEILGETQAETAKPIFERYVKVSNNGESLVFRYYLDGNGFHALTLNPETLEAVGDPYHFKSTEPLTVHEAAEEVQRNLDIFQRGGAEVKDWSLPERKGRTSTAGSDPGGAVADKEENGSGTTISLYEEVGKYKKAKEARENLSKIEQTALEPEGRWLNDEERKEADRLDKEIQRFEDIIQDRFGGGIEDGLFTRTFRLVGAVSGEDMQIETHYLLVDLANQLRSLARTYFGGLEVTDVNVRNYYQYAMEKLDKVGVKPKVDEDTFLQEFKTDRVAIPSP